ncbi:MAG: methyl-accepting chemotaxis protein [Bacteriovoracaceae bacterium]
MKNWSLNLKLTFLMAVFAIGTITVSVVGVFQLDSINTSLNYLTGTVAERVRYAVRLDANTNSIMNLEKSLILEKDPGTQEKISENLNKKIVELQANLKGLRNVGLSDSENLVKLESSFEPVVEIDKQVQSLAIQGMNEAAFELARTKGMKAFGQFDKVLREVNLSAQKEMEVESKKTDQVYQEARLAVIVISSVAILFSALLGFGILRAINKAINRVIEDLTNNSEQVSVAARQISESSQDLSQAATEQASSLEETSSSVEEISSMVKRNSENANNSAQASVEGQKSCEKGKEVIKQMIHSMKEINQANDSVMKQVNESNEKIGEVVKVINEMGEKTKVINDIVFQTKLLSFNASVEAARAGEHGKGFAVVAEEVGNLAQMSGKAATEISEMLDSSIQRVEASISESKEKINSIILVGKEKVDEGDKIARECGEVLDEIVLKSGEINEMVKSIASASEEQSDGIEQITTAMSQLDQVTQTNASTSEEAASAAEELSGQADQLKEAVGILVQNIKGGKGASAGVVPHVSKETRQHSTEDNKVVQFKPKTSEPSRNSGEQLAKASGFGGVPDADDARFKEV